MRRPILKAIKDVCGIDDRSTPFFTFLPEKLQKVGPGQYIKINCYLVKKKNLYKQGSHPYVIESEVFPIEV